MPVLQALKPDAEAFAEDLDALGPVDMAAPCVVRAGHGARDQDEQRTEDEVGDLQGDVGVAVRV
ncbi:hypothetical protein ACL90Y_08515 [Micrococcus luteus]